MKASRARLSDARLERVAQRYTTRAAQPVPVFLTSPNGRFVKRNWACRADNWCDACGEPITVWVQHMGRMDHSLLDLHYNCIADYPHRRWDAGKVLDAAAAGLRKSTTESIARCYKDAEGERRLAIVAMVRKLHADGVLSLGNMNEQPQFAGMQSAAYVGSMTQFRLLPPAILDLFPNASVGALSDVMCFVLASYNMETVYDLCGFKHIDEATGQDDAPDMSPFAAKAAASFGGGSAGAVGGVADGEAPADDETGAGGVGFSRKGSFVRGLLGQLRFVSGEKPVSGGGTVQAHHEVIARELSRAICVESLFVRTSEYSLRMEPVWRAKGMEQLRADAPLYNPDLGRATNARGSSAAVPGSTVDPGLRITSEKFPVDARRLSRHLNM
jgi:hypothetical protein